MNRTVPLVRARSQRLAPPKGSQNGFGELWIME